MKLPLNHWINTNRIILTNAGSVISTNAVVSILGFIYWWLAARLFTTEIVGFSSAAISAMTLIGTIGLFGLGTLLIGEIPRQPDSASSLIITALIVAGLIACTLGFLFAIAAPMLSSNLASLSEGVVNTVLFASGVSITAIAEVVDHALVGQLRAKLQFWRNAFFATVKLLALVAAGIWLTRGFNMIIYATWIGSNLASILVLAAYFLFKGSRIRYSRPQWSLLRRFGRTALWHHLLNMSLQIPGLLLPILVTVLFSAERNASFYIAWMIAGFVFIVPTALTTILYAVGSGDINALARKTKTTLMMSLLGCFVLGGLVFLFGGLILSLFGKTYTAQAGLSLRILIIGAFPRTIKSHYIAISRIHERIPRATLIMLIGDVVEIAFSILGAVIAEVPGLCLGWVAAVCVEAVIIGPTVYRTIVPKSLRYTDAALAQ